MAHWLHVGQCSRRWVVMGLGILLATSPTSQAQEKSPSKTLEQRLNEIVLPEISVRDAAVAAIIDHLSQICEVADPQKQGVNFILLGKADPERKYTLQLKKLRVADALTIIAQTTGLKYRVEPSAVVFYTEEAGTATQSTVASVAKPKETGQKEGRADPAETPRATPPRVNSRVAPAPVASEKPGIVLRVSQVASKKQTNTNPDYYYSPYNRRTVRSQTIQVTAIGQGTAEFDYTIRTVFYWAGATTDPDKLLAETKADGEPVGKNESADPGVHHVDKRSVRLKPAQQNTFIVTEPESQVHESRSSYTGTTYHRSGTKTGGWLVLAMRGNQILAVEASDYPIKKPFVDKMNAALHAPAKSN